MPKVSRFFTVAPFILCLLALGACLALCPPAAQAASRTVLINKVAATVNGEAIMLSDLQRTALREMARLNLTPDHPQYEEARQQLFEQALNSMIMDILIRQEAQRYGASVSDAEVENELNMIIQRNQITRKQFEQQLIMQGSSLKQAKEDIGNSILRQRMVTMMVSRKIIVTKEEIARYYEENPEEFTTQHSVDVSMIIAPLDTNLKKVRAEITSGKISFEDAARKYSKAPTAARGGHLGAIPWSDLNDEWRRVLSNMKPGEVSDVMRMGEASLLLKLHTTLEDSVVTLEEATPRIEEILRAPRLNERFEEYYNQLRKDAVVEIKL